VDALFIICAAVGGTILVCQFVMTLIGLGGHAFDMDISTDVGHDFGGGFHADAGVHVDHGDATDHTSDADQTNQAAQHGSTWLFGILSFRTVIAALAFFGLAGLAARTADASTPTVLMVSVGAGLIAMFAVYWMMRALQTLRAEGTVRILGSIGQHGNVYLRVPANRSGNGKIQFNLQNRTMEYLAITSGPELPTGAKVVVVGVVNPTTLEVQAE
jgi:hypothetical protein